MSASRTLACLAVLASLLVAEPLTINLSSYLGVADCDGVALGSNGDAYLACHSPYDRLPIEVKPSKQTGENFDAYVLRLNLRTGKLVYATRIGGSDYDEASRIKVDQQGFAYVVGFTKSKDFPTTPDALQPQFGGGESDAFFAKVAPNGQVVYATFLGGSDTDQGDGLELDSDGGVFVAGTTWSSDFPGQSRPRAASEGDAFVSYFQPGHPNTFRSVVFGGRRQEKLTGIVLDGRGGLFAVGYTKSTDFPTIRPIQAELRGVSDLFLVRLATATLTPTFSTYFGGSGDDSGWGVTVDSPGNPVVAGITDSKDLPTSEGAYQHTNYGGLAAFVAKFQGAGYQEVRSTYFGGSNDDSSGYDGDDIKLDRDGNVWLVGLTSSRDLPTKRALQPRYGGGDLDGFLAAFSPDLMRLCYGSYYGGTDRDFLEGLDVAKSGNLLVVGLTFSHDVPLPGNGVQRQMSPVSVAGKFVNATLLGLRAIKPCR